MAEKDTTTSYQFAEGQPIRRIDVRAQSNGRAVAYLYADPSEESRIARQNIRAALRLKGWGTLSDHRDGAFALRVSGLHDAEELLSLLRAENHIHGTPTVTRVNAATEKPKGLIETIKATSLRASGILYSVGNAVYISSGLLRRKESGVKDTGQIRAGLLWGVGDALVATIGGRDDDRQFTSLLNKLQHHLNREGIEIPATAAIHAETSTKDKSLGSRIYDVMREYLNPIKCASEVAAAFNYHEAGVEQGNVWKQRTAWIFGLGFFASLVIPEKKIDDEKYAQAGPLTRLWMKIQSNPLSVGGISGYSNTILTTYGAYEEGRRYNNPTKYPTLPNPKTGEIKPPSKYYKLDYAAPAVMFFGNSLYAMSKKNTGGDIKTDALISDVYSVAAQILNKQPDAVREAAIDSTARFLGERPEIKDTHQEIIVRLKQEMDIQRQNPWFEKQGLPAYKPAPKHRGAVRDAAALADTPLADAAPLNTVHASGIEHAQTTPEQALQH